jgi:hypothetical protein
MTLRGSSITNIPVAGSNQQPRRLQARYGATAAAEDEIAVYQWITLGRQKLPP